jgi:hypothetical protein
MNLFKSVMDNAKMATSKESQRQKNYGFLPASGAMHP